jgi:hypothetical protein
MSATPYIPREPSTQTAYATVHAVNGGKVDLDFGGDEPVADVGCYGAVPQPGDRVLVLIQGSGMTVLGTRPPAVPRLRGRMPNIAVVNIAAPATWTGALVASYVEDRVTWSNGTITFAEAGIYMIGGQFQTDRPVVADQRAFIAWIDGTATRFAFSRAEDTLSFSFVTGGDAGATREFKVYQESGGTANFSNAYLNIAKISDL